MKPNAFNPDHSHNYEQVIIIYPNKLAMQASFIIHENFKHISHKSLSVAFKKASLFLHPCVM